MTAKENCYTTLDVTDYNYDIIVSISFVFLVKAHVYSISTVNVFIYVI